MFSAGGFSSAAALLKIHTIFIVCNWPDALMHLAVFYAGLSLRCLFIHHFANRMATSDWLTSKLHTSCYVTLRNVSHSWQYDLLYYITICYITLQDGTLRYIMVRYVVIHCVTLPYVTLFLGRIVINNIHSKSCKIFAGSYLGRKLIFQSP